MRNDITFISQDSDEYTRASNAYFAKFRENVVFKNGTTPTIEQLYAAIDSNEPIDEFPDDGNFY